MHSFVEINDATVICETEKALLCEIGGEEYWLPKSQIGAGSEVSGRGDTGTLSIARWLAESRGLIEDGADPEDPGDPSPLEDM